ncbi:hypothetical protein SLEP1_g45283 [Rubroshorea leprosula]|uniref:Uncharacterized protein n=1 Tax=Rubroshorea leprosula TaxID=152421 RepID=A0AAV5LK99_9ROSI|nr:hypothetical protein SLEP1_g45283 [Rubroshorea leprosula]
MCHDVKNFYKSEGKSITGDFRHAGTMAAALVLQVSDRTEELEDTVSIYAEASNGQMPNLDLINIVYYLAAHYRQGFRVKVERLWSLLDCTLLKVLRIIIVYVGEVARRLNPEWKFGIPATDYIEGTATLASSLYSEALGVPTGPHGAFRDYQVDAITLEFSPKFTSDMKVRRNDFFLRGGWFIEGVIQSVNNLLEKFHQLFFLYLLTSPNKFVSVGVYIIAFALLIAPLPMVVAFVYIIANNSNSSLKQEKSTLSPFPAADEHSITVSSWRWLNAAKVVFIIHLWGVVVSFLPYFICQIQITPQQLAL